MSLIGIEFNNFKYFNISIHLYIIYEVLVLFATCLRVTICQQLFFTSVLTKYFLKYCIRTDTRIQIKFDGINKM